MQECNKYAIVKGFCVPHAKVQLGNEEFDRLHREVGQCTAFDCQKKTVLDKFCVAHARVYLAPERFAELHKI